TRADSVVKTSAALPRQQLGIAPFSESLRHIYIIGKLVPPTPGIGPVTVVARIRLVLGVNKFRTQLDTKPFISGIYTGAKKGLISGCRNHRAVVPAIRNSRVDPLLPKDGLQLERAFAIEEMVYAFTGKCRICTVNIIPQQRFVIKRPNSERQRRVQFAQ